LTAPDRRLRWLLWAAGALIALGIWAFLLRGADGPEDPVVGGTASAEAPGDPGRVPLPGFREVAITVDPGDGRGLLEWCLLAALDAQQRSRGFIGVDHLEGYPGIAFVYTEDWQNPYHMRGVPIPLSIAWLDVDGQIVRITDMEPCDAAATDCPAYSADGSYRMAIEVPLGGLDALGIVPGSTTEISGKCAEPSPID
jgi:uncharacterized membrane protein (UPF0127 family)